MDDALVMGGVHVRAWHLQADDRRVSCNPTRADAARSRGIELQKRLSGASGEDRVPLRVVELGGLAEDRRRLAGPSRTPQHVRERHPRVTPDAEIVGPVEYVWSQEGAGPAVRTCR
jgi:hypothetical protein